jgi:hypothetical protein
MSKRKRTTRDNCSICQDAGRNPIGHSEQFCGYPGGPYPTPQEGTAAKRAADKGRFLAAKGKQQGGVQIMNFLTELTSRDQKIKELEDLIEKLEDKLESIRETVNGNSQNISALSYSFQQWEGRRAKVIQERKKQKQQQEAKAKAAQQSQWDHSSSSSSSHYGY